MSNSINPISTTSSSEEGSSRPISPITSSPSQPVTDVAKAALRQQIEELRVLVQKGKMLQIPEARTLSIDEFEDDLENLENPDSEISAKDLGMLLSTSIWLVKSNMPAVDKSDSKSDTPDADDSVSV
ncbi:MAG TPA: hypothetical protein VLF61_02025 [Rhabdochlamydiaceae bacterium]|nr:hypothetical protein [Rhabdochlamydiaceae bacterium]